jgi:hypothetical protein
MVTKSLKVAKAKRKEERGQSEADKLLGQYAKKKKYLDAKLTEKPAKGDLSWLEKLVAGPDQTHCFISGVAFESSMSEVNIFSYLTHPLSRSCCATLHHLNAVTRPHVKINTGQAIAQEVRRGGRFPHADHCRQNGRGQR